MTKLRVFDIWNGALNEFFLIIESLFFKLHYFKTSVESGPQAFYYNHRFNSKGSNTTYSRSSLLDFLAHHGTVSALSLYYIIILESGSF